MPNVDPTQNDTTESPEVKKPEADMGNAINAAVSNHLKRFAEKQLPTMLAEAMKPFAEQIAALKTAPPAPTPAADDKTKTSPEVAALTAQLAEMKTRLAQEGEQRAAAEKKAREDRAFSDLKSYLAPTVRPEMLDVIANHLFHIQKVVDVDDAGNATFKGSRSLYGGITEDVAYPLKDGVEQWSKSDSAKPYLPSPGTSQAAPTQRRHVAAPKYGKDVDVKNLTPQQRVQYAEELEAQWGAVFDQAGMKL